MLPNGQRVDRITLSSPTGVSVSLLSYGATVSSIRVPSKSSGPEEVTLCYPDLPSLVAKSPYYGSTVGRVANRIAHATFSLGGRTHSLARNNNGHTLHGGVRGYDKHVWDYKIVTGAGGDVGVQFSRVSRACVGTRGECWGRRRGAHSTLFYTHPFSFTPPTSQTMARRGTPARLT